MTSTQKWPPNWHEVTAIFGGTFDPPHIGHREAVQGLFKDPGVKQVLILPSPTPPHKQSFASIEHRIAMTRLNFENIEINLHEINSASSPSFTFNTLQYFRKTIPNLAFVIGADQLKDMPSKWWRFPEILQLCHWIVLERKPLGSTIARPTLTQWETSNLVRSEHNLLGPMTWQVLGGNTFLKLVPTDAPPISSTAIREAIARTGKPPEGTLLTAIEAYLKQNRLYGSKVDA